MHILDAFVSGMFLESLIHNAMAGNTGRAVIDTFFCLVNGFIAVLGWWRPWDLKQESAKEAE